MTVISKVFADPETKALAKPLQTCGVQLVHKAYVRLEGRKHEHKMRVAIMLRGEHKDIAAMKKHLAAPLMDQALPWASAVRANVVPKPK